MTQRIALLVACALPCLSSAFLSACGEQSKSNGSEQSSTPDDKGPGVSPNGSSSNGPAKGPDGPGASSDSDGSLDGTPQAGPTRANAPQCGSPSSAIEGSSVVSPNAGAPAGGAPATSSSQGIGGSSAGLNGGSSDVASGPLSEAGGAGGASAAGGSNGATSDAGGANGSVATGVQVQLDKTFQTIRGFGITTAFTPSNVSLPMDDLFGTDGPDAIGLSILRVGMNTDGSLTGIEVSEAKARGARIIGTVMSPPKECKTNGNTQQGGHLLPKAESPCYEEWATTISKFAQTQQLYAMSLGDAPDFASCAAKGPPCSNDFDSTLFTAKEMVEWVKVAAPKLTAVGVKVIAPEVSEWIHAWSNASATGSAVTEHPDSSDPLECGCFSNTPTDTGCASTCLDGNGYDYGHWLWGDQDAWKAFDIFGVQQYDSLIGYAWPSDVNGGKPDKEVWQTEMSGMLYWPEQGPSTDIGNGVAVASWVHSALTVGGASAWIWRFYQSYFLDDNEGLALTKGGSRIAKRYYALGNYSKFVRPGYIAVQVNGNQNSELSISAFKSTEDKVVVVAINKGATDAQLPITIAGGTAPTSVTPHVTAVDENLVEGTPIPVENGAFTAVLGAMTVTTFVGE
ncbi:MAG TPA: glycoside hydrolase family 30 beta sandwich domain-containing protein [Polyangiaceae bacterium]|nr:glycoside hydrolase family 30 beta sandwich domain-containing protein [Polyangiaceae bacterium]